MYLALVWIWWIIVVALLLTLIILWFKQIINNSVAALLLMLLIVLVIIGILWFSYWGNVNDSTLQPGNIYWYTSNETRTSELDTSIVNLKFTDANNNNQIGTVNVGVMNQTLTMSNILISTTPTTRYVVRIENKSSNPINISISSDKLTFSGPSKTAP